MPDGVSFKAVWVQCDRCKKWRQAPDWTISPNEDTPWYCEVRGAARGPANSGAPHTRAHTHALTHEPVAAKRRA